MANHSVKVFVDADAFIALVKSDDQNHTKAKAIFHKLSVSHAHFMTSNYVFAEVVTVLSQRVSKEAALKFIDQIKAEDGLKVWWVDEEIERIAINIFKRQTSKNISFMDCCHMACVKNHHLDEVFSFDYVYERNTIPLSVS